MKAALTPASSKQPLRCRRLRLHDTGEGCILEPVGVMPSMTERVAEVERALFLSLYCHHGGRDGILGTPVAQLATQADLAHAYDVFAQDTTTLVMPSTSEIVKTDGWQPTQGSLADVVAPCHRHLGLSSCLSQHLRSRHVSLQRGLGASEGVRVSGLRCNEQTRLCATSEATMGLDTASTGRVADEAPYRSSRARSERSAVGATSIAMRLAPAL